MNKLQNATPKRYRAYYIEPGLADYTAEGIGMVLVQKPALDRISPTYVGKPVVNLEHTDKEPEELFELSKNSKPEDFADGIIAATGLLKEDVTLESGKTIPAGWYWMDILVWDQETMDNIDNNGFSVSCAYDPTEVDDAGGKYHNVEYDGEVLNGEGLHLAVVPNPRYENAVIIKNSLGGKKMAKKFTILGRKKPLKNQEPEPKTEPDKKDEPVENSAILNMDDEVQVGEEKMTVENLINMAGFGEEEEPELENMDDAMVTLPSGKEMLISELVAAYQAKQGGDDLENAEPAQDIPAEPVLKDNLQNSVPATEKPNANFKKVKNAASQASLTEQSGYSTKADRLKKGQALYGKKANQEVS